MAWAYLALAIGFEICGTVALKLSNGFAQVLPSLVILPAYAVSFVFLTFAVKSIPISVAYAVWSGVGIAVISLIGMAWFREPVSPAKLAFIAVIVIGIIGLHIADRYAHV
ncbi:MAG: multidrug efflux SMR transporter [Rhodospirillales bacterium]|nr:multidrug efflux SMR transporter [Rhodospirillales bacterium]